MLFFRRSYTNISTHFSDDVSKNGIFFELAFIVYVVWNLAYSFFPLFFKTFYIKLVHYPDFVSYDIFYSFISYPYLNFSGLLLSVLTTYIYFIISLYYFFSSSEVVNYRFFIFFLIITEFSLYLTFFTSNFLLFYILFEFILIPFYFIVLIWGSRPTKVGASFRLVFFTLVFSSPLTVLMAINFYDDLFSFNFQILFSTLSTNSIFLQIAFFFSSFLAFAVKIPLFPAHVWLPEAHGEAPTFGSVLLAGVLLKLGGYGFYQVFYEFINPVWSMQVFNFFTFTYVVSILTIFYSNIIVFNQLDIKRTIAYYSIGHMGFVTLGFITNNVEGYSGAILIMLSHGLSAAGLFFCVGYLYEQSHTRSILAFRGIAATTPVLASLIFFFICANISFPGTANFIGEQLVLIGLAKLDPALSFLPVMGVLLNGLSTFLFYIRLAFGEVTNETVFIRELQTHKFLLLIVLFFPIVIAGFFPNFLVNIISKI